MLYTIVNTVRVFSKDIKMEFGVEKCAVLIMKRGKFISSEGICLPDGQRIKSVEKEEGYKYLGVLEADWCKPRPNEGNNNNNYYYYNYYYLLLLLLLSLLLLKLLLLLLLYIVIIIVIIVIIIVIIAVRESNILQG